jgi:hypothetical protein
LDDLLTYNFAIFTINKIPTLSFMLYRATPATSAQLQALQNLSKTAEYRTEGENSIEFWKFSNRVGMPSEIFVARSEEPELRQFLKQNQIAHHTLVHDFGMLDFGGIILN